MDIAMDPENLRTVIEGAYRQIYFHAFKSDRDVNLESQLRDGQITVEISFVDSAFRTRSKASTA